jgi:hypothetical protein
MEEDGEEHYHVKSFFVDFEAMKPAKMVLQYTPCSIANCGKPSVLPPWEVELPGINVCADL